MWLTKELAVAGAGAGAGAIVTGAGMAYLLSNKKHGDRLKEIGKTGLGSIIGAGILGLGWLLNEENWDKFMKGVSKVDYPDWYKSLKTLFGLNENETSKS